ncbi:MAG TPA: thiamine-phosphate kinase [Candidatus Acidoferrum sp.]|nr:thiamine-phosphate kinase [Candidatus Acidoferrum sp.]
MLKRIASGAKGARHSAAGVHLGIGDDAALFAPRAGRETILTCDWSLEGTHFLREKHPADAVGWKSLARAVSDVAAMGGTPRCYLLSLALPASHTGRWLGEFLRGLRRASRAFRCELAGGDTTQRDEILINIMVAGEIAPGQALRRTGARAGDLLYISGRLGEADRGWERLQKMRGRVRANDRLLRKHLYPEPRLALGEWLAKNRLATAAMDLSDGLSIDLMRLCAASGVGARVEVASLPMLQDVDREKAVKLALHGGDDYELLFTVAPRKAHHIPMKFRGLQLTQIGRIRRERKIEVRAENGRVHRLRPGGWDPFRK